MSSRCFAYRRTIAIGAVWAAAMVGLAVTSPPASGQESAQESFDPGVGDAQSRLIKVEPKLGGLSFGITAGLSLAGHQNTVAQADSRAIDLGVIGTTLAGEGCDGGDPTLAKEDQPQPVVARSGTAEASGGKESNEIPGINQHARATEVPFAEAVTTLAPMGVKGVIDISSGVATTSSGVVEDGIREARAVVEFGQIKFVGGAATLRGLKWEAVHRSGDEEGGQGEFTVDALSVAGAPVPIGDGAAAINEVNQALRLLGFELLVPEVRIVDNVVFVDPLRIAIIPAELRDNITGQLLGAAQPVRESLYEQLLELDCGNATYITVADIALGAVTAAGELGLEVGGAKASTASIDAFEFPATGFKPAGPTTLSPPPTPAETPDLGGSTGGDLPTTQAPSTTEAPPTTAATTDVEEALPVVDSVSGERGGAMAAVAGAGLLLLAALAEADRRKMRRAQREIPMEMA